MKSDLERWLKEVGERFLKEVGIGKGQTVLDFGCGSGDARAQIQEACLMVRAE
jgi:ubiquinone/menaquinone biosynthesis C-methylase UbiE